MPNGRMRLDTRYINVSLISYFFFNIQMELEIYLKSSRGGRDFNIKALRNRLHGSVLGNASL